MRIRAQPKVDTTRFYMSGGYRVDIGVPEPSKVSCVSHYCRENAVLPGQAECPEDRELGEDSDIVLSAIHVSLFFTCADWNKIFLPVHISWLLGLLNEEKDCNITARSQRRKLKKFFGPFNLVMEP